MKRTLNRTMLAFVAVLPATMAAAQNYQSALELSAEERRAAEAQLSTILDYSGPGETTRIVLPTGRQMLVRTYPKVDGGGAPCRGYRIDLSGGGGSMAVDGFRCRSASGAAWVIVEPETVLSREGSPGGGLADTVTAALRRDGGAPQDLRAQDDVRAADEPLYSDEPLPEPRVVPLPRPAPERPEPTVAALGDDQTPAAAPSENDADRLAAVRSALDPEAAATQEIAPEPVEENGTTIAQSEPSGAAPPEAGADAEPLSADDDGEQVIAAAGPQEPPADAGDGPFAISEPDGTARIVDPSADDSLEPEYGSDERIVAALEDLDYLDPSAPLTDEAITRAVDDFARDETFALPVSTDALLERLDEAIDRSLDVPDCTGSDADALCLEPAQ